MTGAFDRFIAIDWSGARAGYDGVALAECGGGGALRLLWPPQGRRWTRTLAAEWIEAAARSPARTLVGCDFAFGFAAGATPFVSAPDLWQAVEERCTADPDLYGGAFLAGPLAARYWRSGSMPSGFDRLPRRTERQCAARKWGVPESVFKLIGSKQVGLASLAGMRLLHRLRAAGRGSIAVWPFEPIDAARLVVVEIFPRAFIRMAGAGGAKLHGAALSAAIDFFTANPAAADDDHQSDALISAAALRALARCERPWQPDGADGDLQREGWIFGVC